MCSVFVNDTATTEIYTLSLHDALPIFGQRPVDLLHGAGVQRAVLVVAGEADDDQGPARRGRAGRIESGRHPRGQPQDRKSTRLNSSHANISYAVFCLKNTTAQNRLKLL